MNGLADKLEPRAVVRLEVTRTLAFRCLCGIAQAPRFYVGLATAGALHALCHLAGVL